MDNRRVVVAPCRMYVDADGRYHFYRIRPIAAAVMRAMGDTAIIDRPFVEVVRDV